MGFTVIIKEIATDKSPQEVAKQVAAMSKTSARKVAAALKHLPMAVKKNLDSDTAERYRATLEKVGVIVEIIEEQPPVEINEDTPYKGLNEPPPIIAPAIPPKPEAEVPPIETVRKPRLMPLLFFILALPALGVAGWYAHSKNISVRKAIASFTGGTKEAAVNLESLPHATVSPIPLPQRPPLSAGDFKAQFPPPDWLESITAPDIGSVQELAEYWRDRERTESQFFRAALGLLARYPDKPEYLMKIVNLLPMGYSSYEKMLALEEYALGAFFSFNDPDNQKPGTTVAEIAIDAMNRYNKLGEFAKTIGLGKRLFEEREKDINEHMLELASIPLANAYAGAGDVRSAVETLGRAIEKYNGSWKKDLQETREKMVRGK